LKKQNIVVVYETKILAKDTLFPEKLKRMNQILAKIDGSLVNSCRATFYFTHSTRLSEKLKTTVI